jgi:hypothetical protein
MAYLYYYNIDMELNTGVADIDKEKEITIVPLTNFKLNDIFRFGTIEGEIFWH